MQGSLQVAPSVLFSSVLDFAIRPISIEMILIFFFIFEIQTNKARFKRRSIHAPNLTDELSTAEERRLNQFGSAD